jgi:hypothetical protein
MRWCNGGRLPALLLPGITIVVSPLVALMAEQLANLPPLLQVFCLDVCPLLNITCGARSYFVLLSVPPYVSQPSPVASFSVPSRHPSRRPSLTSSNVRSLGRVVAHASVAHKVRAATLSGSQGGSAGAVAQTLADLQVRAPNHQPIYQPCSWCHANG